MKIHRPERLALKRFLTIDTFRENYRDPTVAAGSEGVSVRCRQRPSLFASTIRIQACLADLPGPSAELILLTKREVPASEIYQNTPERSPILVRTVAPESVEGNFVKRTFRIQKRPDISSVRGYVERVTQLPARILPSLRVEFEENGNRREFDSSYLFVSRNATLDDVRKKRASLGEKDPFDLEVVVNLEKETTIITLTYPK